MKSCKNTPPPPQNRELEVKKLKISTKRIISVFSACLLALTCVVYAPPATAAVDYTPAPSTDITAAFTDPNFLAEVRKLVNKPTAPILYSDVSGITGLIVERTTTVSNLNGVEYFTALTDLTCYSNQLTTLDVSHNTALTKLDCFNNQLTALDVSKNTTLTLLECSNNQLTTLDVSQNAALIRLSCFRNQLKTLDVSQNIALTRLQCSSNQLTTLDVSQNTALTNLTCDANQLTTLNVSQNTTLTLLECSNNQLTTLDVSPNTALYWLSCQANQLTTLDVSQNTALTTLQCGSNQLTTLDVSQNTALTTLYCGLNPLTTLDVSQNTALDRLTCGYNQLTTLDVSKNTVLTYLECSKNQLTTLDVSQNTALIALYCRENRLATLDMSKNIALILLDCYYNKLITLDISKNVALTHLLVQNNYFQSKTAIIGLDTSGLIERATENYVMNNGGGYIYEPQQTGTPTPTPPSPPAPPSGGEYNPDPGDVIQVPVLPGDYDVPGSCTDPTVISKIDFMNEVLIVPDNYYIGAYSIDGGRSWKSGSPIDSKIAVPVNGFRGGFITKFLNKGGALVLAEGFNPATKQPVGTRIVFPNVEPRPKALRLQANYEAAHKQSGTMQFSPTTPNYWTLTERNKDMIIFEHMLIMKSTNGKDMNSIWVTMPKAGIAVENPSGTTRKAETTTYFVSTAPIITSNLITPKSKVVKIKVKSAIAIRPLSFNKKTGACKFSVGTAVSTVSKTEIFSKGSTYTPSDTDAMTGYVLLPTAKNPASVPVIIG
ncbi:hypothetical protein FACS1894217_06950 [Clostridia bacterium]|nr:hypothetical protein FACS1894217_06950 [Clostridia bacterium]